MPITAIFQLWGTNPKENNTKKKKKNKIYVLRCLSSVIISEKPDMN